MPDHTDRKQAQPASTAGESGVSASLTEYSAAIVETVREPLVLLDSGLRVLVANAAFYRTFGGTPAAVRRRSLYDLAEGRWDAPDLHTVLEALRERDIAFEDHEVEVTINGTPRVFRLNARKLVSPDPESLTLLLAFEDVSERLRVEERLRDLARMEAVGQLAGGVAHEINNQMTVLMGFMSFVTRDLDERDPRMQDLRYAERAAEHVVYITRHLLNFSRKQMIRRETIDPWTVLVGMQTLLGRVLGPGIQVNIVRTGEVRAVEFDAGQLSEVFLNLALNARYAMGRTGTFEIALSAVDIEETPPSADPGPPGGRYLRFDVRDTGSGMDENIRKRVFEPFFTTKPIGEGTGLGLASVFGAVTQNGGFITVESKPGAGTTFVIDLPEVPLAASSGDPLTSVEDLPRGTETIIVAEDEEGVRSWINRVLRECGYTVLEARHGAEALRLYAQNASTVALVLTDLVMAGADGREVGERMAHHAPQVPVLYMSAYTEDEILRRQLLQPNGALLQKPMSPSTLAQRVRSALDAAAQGTEGLGRG